MGEVGICDTVSSAFHSVGRVAGRQGQFHRDGAQCARGHGMTPSSRICTSIGRCIGTEGEPILTAASRSPYGLPATHQPVSGLPPMVDHREKRPAWSIAHSIVSGSAPLTGKKQD